MHPLRQSSVMVVIASLMLLCATLFVPVHATEIGLLAGSSTTSSDRWTRSATLSIGLGKHFTWHKMQLQPIISLNWVDGRGTSRDHLDGDVMVGGAGLRAVNFYRNLFASFQLGLAAGRTDALSSAGQFITTVGWHGSHMVLAVQHISNGRIFGGRNLGETMLMVGYRF